MKEKLKGYWKKRHYRVVFYLTVALGIFFLVSSIIAITMYAVLPDSAVGLLPKLDQPNSNDRILVLSPHPDDETIAVGGYIYQAKQNNAEVKIVLVTDGNKHGWQETRFKEFRNSARLLGVPEADLEFWNFTEGMTDDSELEPITKMIVAEIKTFNPTIIVTSLEEDYHFDHHLVGEGYLAAAGQAGFSGQAYGYLVHHRFFPQPKHYAPNHNLMPPIKYLNLYNGWVNFGLTDEAEDIKNEAVLGYHSQLRIPLLKGLLKSMIRENEIFVRLN